MIMKHENMSRPPPPPQGSAAVDEAAPTGEIPRRPQL